MENARGGGCISVQCDELPLSASCQGIGGPRQSVGVAVDVIETVSEVAANTPRRKSRYVSVREDEWHIAEYPALHVIQACIKVA